VIVRPPLRPVYSDAVPEYRRHPPPVTEVRCSKGQCSGPGGRVEFVASKTWPQPCARANGAICRWQRRIHSPRLELTATVDRLRHRSLIDGVSYCDRILILGPQVAAATGAALLAMIGATSATTSLSTRHAMRCAMRRPPISPGRTSLMTCFRLGEQPMASRATPAADGRFHFA